MANSCQLSEHALHPKSFPTSFLSALVFYSFLSVQLGATEADLTCGVASYGAVGDGQAYDTAAIQQAVDACSQPGNPGTVLFEEGRTYLTGSIALANSVHVILPSNSTLIAGTKVQGQTFDASESCESCACLTLCSWSALLFVCLVHSDPICWSELARLILS